jgi:hypothetical protein
MADRRMGIYYREYERVIIFLYYIKKIKNPLRSGFFVFNRLNKVKWRTYDKITIY